MILKNGFRYVFVFLLGAVIYNLVEVIFRGYTHWSMSVAGGSVLLIFYLLSDWLAALHPVIGGMIGALVITCIELIAGVIFNILLRQDVWDYSNMPLNFLGQICRFRRFGSFSISRRNICALRSKENLSRKRKISSRRCSRRCRLPSPGRVSPGRNPTRGTCTL